MGILFSGAKTAPYPLPPPQATASALGAPKPMLVDDSAKMAAGAMAAANDASGGDPGNNASGTIDQGGTGGFADAGTTAATGGI